MQEVEQPHIGRSDPGRGQRPQLDIAIEQSIEHRRKQRRLARIEPQQAATDAEAGHRTAPGDRLGAQVDRRGLAAAGEQRRQVEYQTGRYLPGDDHFDGIWRPIARRTQDALAATVDGNVAEPRIERSPAEIETITLGSLHGPRLHRRRRTIRTLAHRLQRRHIGHPLQRTLIQVQATAVHHQDQA
ncbi:hypothetical protein D9M71_406400 [compost metagenome]